MPVPNTFANATTSIPLSQLDQNFATAITLGNTAIQLGNTVTTLNNMTLANVTVSTGNVSFTQGTIGGNVVINTTGTANTGNLSVTGTLSSTGSITTTGGQIYVRGTGSSQNYEYEIGNDDTFVQQYASRNSGVSKGYKWYTSNTGASLRMTLDSTGLAVTGTINATSNINLANNTNLRALNTDGSTYHNLIGLTQGSPTNQIGIGDTTRDIYLLGKTAVAGALSSTDMASLAKITTSADCGLAASGTGRIGGLAAYGLQLTGQGSSYDIIFTNKGGSTAGYVATGATTITTSSDERLKENFKPIENAVQIINNLRTVTGNYKSDPDRTVAFLIAQDLDEHFPPAVDKSDPDSWGVNYNWTVPLMMAAIKELNAKVAALEAKNAQV